MSLDRNLCTGIWNSWAILFSLTFLRAGKAAMAWIIRSSTSAGGIEDGWSKNYVLPSTKLGRQNGQKYEVQIRNLKELARHNFFWDILKISPKSCEMRD